MKTYLESLGHAEKSINRTLQELENFKDWCLAHDYESERLMYKEIMTYIEFLQMEKAVKQITIAKYLCTLKHYYEYLIQDEIRDDNPIRTISIKGIKRKTYHTTFDKDELEELYLNYEIDDQDKKEIQLARKRNKALLGLFVFQGLDSSTIKRMALSHIDLRKGIVHAPYTRKSNE